MTYDISTLTNHKKPLHEWMEVDSEYYIDSEELTKVVLGKFEVLKDQLGNPIFDSNGNPIAAEKSYNLIAKKWEKFGMFVENETQINNTFLESKKFLEINSVQLLRNDFIVQNISITEKNHFIYAKYKNKDYTIVLESSHDLFNIEISNDKKEFTNLCYRYDFSNTLNVDNLSKAFSLLREMLKKNDFPLYIINDDKIYMTYKGNTKKIKTIEKEHLQGI